MRRSVGRVDPSRAGGGPATPLSDRQTSGPRRPDPLGARGRTGDEGRLGAKVPGQEMGPAGRRVRVGDAPVARGVAATVPGCLPVLGGPAGSPPHLRRSAMVPSRARRVGRGAGVEAAVATVVGPTLGRPRAGGRATQRTVARTSTQSDTQSRGTGAAQTRALPASAAPAPPPSAPPPSALPAPLPVPLLLPRPVR